jgi:hypothetical protein
MVTLLLIRTMDLAAVEQGSRPLAQRTDVAAMDLTLPDVPEMRVRSRIPHTLVSWLPRV